MTSLYFQITAFAVLVLLLIVYFTKKRVNNRETKLYSRLLVITFFALIFDIAIVLTTYLNPLEKVEVNLKIMNKFYFSFLLYWVSTFCLYLIYLSLIEKENRFFRVEKTIKILDFFSIFIIFLLPVHIVHENGVMYSYGLSTNFMVLVIALLVIVALLYTLQNIKNINSKKYYPLFILILLLFLNIIVHNLIPELLLTTAAATYVVLIMYFTIENPDVKMIEALNEAKLSAEKANLAKTEFLSSMSHEIRTPLNAIVGFSDCILEEEELDAAKNDANDIKLASENLLEIVNGILDISKIEANKMEIVETEYDLVTILNNLVKLVKPRIGEKPIEFISEFSSDLPYLLYGDSGKLKQILTNILTNAAKYTEAGAIKFMVTCVNEGKVTKLVMSVEDTGRGIKPEHIDRLFNKFERLEEDRNTTLEGTGLGLAITKQFVEMMGGKIVVQSVYGSGSKFTVYLMQKVVAHNRPETEVKEIVKDEIADYHEKRVLVVDDNQINLKVANKLLSKYHIQTVNAESGFECLDFIHKGEHFDLILLDDMMPKMSGVETLKKLQAMPTFKIPVVALTANAISGMKEKYLSDGFDEYLSKPIDKEELAQILNKYLQD